MAVHTFSCLDGHTCGNPVRLVSGGGPRLEGATMLERRAHFLRDFDWIRTGLMFEPRGHDMMSGSILYPPTRPDCDVAVLFIETSGCLPMCGHGLIGTITMGIENGLITPRAPGALSIETPAGKVDITYVQEGRFVEEVRLTNVPGFLHAEGLTAEVEGLVHDVLNVFMCTGFSRDTGQYLMKASPVRPGDYLELFAEIDLIGGLSACPGGDCGAEHSSNAAPCHPLLVEIFAPAVPTDRPVPQPSPYRWP